MARTIEISRLTLLAAVLIAMSGCASQTIKDEVIANPAVVVGAPYKTVFQTAVDVIEERFEIARRSPTDGEIESKAKPAFPSLWVPWASDAMTGEYAVEETLHEVRRKLVATIRQLGSEKSELKITVSRERRNYENPPTSFNAQYNLYDPSISNLKPMPYDPATHLDWAYIGPDVHMEQYLLKRILTRLKAISAAE